MHRIRFDVETWACGAAQEEVQETLLACAGVQEATVDLEAEQVAVNLETEAAGPREEVEHVLEFYGLRARAAGTEPRTP